ncbi:hypothetical protein MKW92_029141, partial [Papaver armeniacum]
DLCPYYRSFSRSDSLGIILAKLNLNCLWGNNIISNQIQLQRILGQICMLTGYWFL